MRAVKKSPKTSVGDITNDLQSAGVNASQFNKTERINIEAIPQDANHQVQRWAEKLLEHNLMD
jgi:hypothetical protein